MSGWRWRRPSSCCSPAAWRSPGSATATTVRWRQARGRRPRPVGPGRRLPARMPRRLPTPRVMHPRTPLRAGRLPLRPGLRTPGRARPVRRLRAALVAGHRVPQPAVPVRRPGMKRWRARRRVIPPALHRQGRREPDRRPGAREAGRPRATRRAGARPVAGSSRPPAATAMAGRAAGRTLHPSRAATGRRTRRWWRSRSRSGKALRAASSGWRSPVPLRNWTSRSERPR